MTKKKKKSSRAWCASRNTGKFSSSYGTPTWIPTGKPSEPPIPANRIAARHEEAQERGAYGAMVKKDQRQKRKSALKKKRREVQKVRNQTKKAIARAAA